MYNFKIKFIIIISLICIPCLGYMEYFGYQSYQENDSIIKYRPVKLGSLQLEMSQIHIVHKGSYLDIVEDAWISGNLSSFKYPNITGDYFYKGTINLPNKIAITGMQTWKDTKMYRAKLKSSQYDYDQTISDPASLESFIKNKVIHLQQLNQNTYKLTFTMIDLGERKHIRIRYLLPNTTDGDANYNIPVIFHCPYNTNPKHIKISMITDSLNSYTIKSISGSIEIKDSSANIIPYQSQINIHQSKVIHSAIHTSEFYEGEWQGNYLSLNTSIPDSVIKNLSNKMETVFIWRWNNNYNFISQSSQMKTLSSQAYEVIDKAKSIKETMKKLSEIGHKCALIHSIEGNDIIQFGMGSKSDSTFIKAIEYLSKFDEQYMYNTYKNGKSTIPDWVPIESPNQTIIKNAQNEFLTTIKLTKALFSTDNQKNLKHVIFSSFINTPSSYDIITSEFIDTAFSDITCDPNNSSWRGINLNKIIPSTNNQGLFKWGNHYYPSFQPTTIKLSIKSGNTKFQFPLNINTNTFNIKLKAKNEWDTLLTWVGYDHLNDSMGMTLSKPFIYSELMDSGLAKLWACDEEHQSETPSNEENHLSFKYGFVSKSMYLQATTSDISNDTSFGVAFLSEDEIVPIELQHVNKKKSIYYNFFKGNLSITTPNKTTLNIMKVYDLKGKLLLKINLQKFHKCNGKYLIPLESIMKNKSQSIFIISVHGSSFSKTFKITSRR